MFQNGASWCRAESTIARYYYVEFDKSVTPGNGVDRIRLNGYKKEAFYHEHKEITLYLENQKYQYEVAAVYVTNVAQSSGYYDYLHKETRKQQMDYLQKMNWK